MSQNINAQCIDIRNNQHYRFFDVTALLDRCFDRLVKPTLNWKTHSMGIFYKFNRSRKAFWSLRRSLERIEYICGYHSLLCSVRTAVNCAERWTSWRQCCSYFYYFFAGNETMSHTIGDSKLKPYQVKIHVFPKSDSEIERSQMNSSLELHDSTLFYFTVNSSFLLFIQIDWNSVKTAMWKDFLPFNPNFKYNKPFISWLWIRVFCLNETAFQNMNRCAI